MAPTKVLIIGAGIAGPPLATLLKMKGYDPVLFERADGPSTTGHALGIAFNGQAVLNKIPGLLEELRAVGCSIESFPSISVVPEDKGVLSEISASAASGFPGAAQPIMLRRATLLKTLSAHAEKADVPFRWGHKMESLEQTEHGVKVRFANGVEEEGSFVVGCDGLHSNVRKVLFGVDKPDFTSLVSCGGFSPVPQAFKNESKLYNIFGNNAHMIASKVDEDTVFWSCTTREAQAPETWSALDDAKAEDFKKNSAFANWDFCGGELVRTGYDLMRYGLYDRPELKSWHKGRVVLVGDAAHPTSPHLGQGANQAFEDINMLVQLLEKHNPGAEPLSAALLEVVFAELEAVRIPAASEVVRGARAMGDTRVVEGVQACIERNNAYRKIGDLKDEGATWKKLVIASTVVPADS